MKLTSLLLLSLAVCVTSQVLGSTEVPKSTDAAIRMAESVFSETALTKGQPKSRYNEWMYQNHMIGMGIESLGEVLKRPDFETYYARNLQYFADAMASGARWKHTKHAKKPTTMWHSGFVAGCAELQKRRPHPEFVKAMGAFDAMVGQVPKLKNGALLRYKGHWKSNALQIDDVYMVVPYWARKAELEKNPDHLEHAIDETLAYYELLWDSKTKLMHCLWLQKQKKTAAHHWGRGNGWFVMAITDLLEFVPKTHPKRDALLQSYTAVMSGLVERQSDGGLWHQVLDRPDSFLETSCSAMFTYSLLIGTRRGWLPKKLRGAGIRGWNGLQTKLNDKNQLTDVCPPTDMSDDVKYFLNRSRNTHDQHAIGPFLLAAAEILRIAE